MCFLRNYACSNPNSAGILLLATQRFNNQRHFIDVLAVFDTIGQRPVTTFISALH